MELDLSSPLFEITRVLTRLDHVPRFIVNGWQVYESAGVQPVFTYIFVLH